MALAVLSSLRSLKKTCQWRLLAMINESNVQKTRYEMEDDPNAGSALAQSCLLVSASS